MKLFVCFGIVICIICIVKWLNRPYWYKNIRYRDFEDVIRKLVRLLDNGGVLIIRHKKTKRFIQYVRYTEKKGVRLHFGFPRAPWSKTFYDEMGVGLDKLGVSPIVVETGNTGIPEFLEVDWNPIEDKGFSQAAEVAVLAFVVMGIDTDAVFEANYSGPHNKNAEKEVLKAVRDDANSDQWAKKLANYVLSREDRLKR